MSAAGPSARYSDADSVAQRRADGLWACGDMFVRDVRHEKREVNRKFGRTFFRNESTTAVIFI